MEGVLTFNAPFGELESFLDQTGKLSDSTTFLTQDLLGVCGTDDDFSSGVSNSNFASGVTLLGELPGKELRKLGVEDTVRNELPAFADGGHLMSRRTLA